VPAKIQRNNKFGIRKDRLKIDKLLNYQGDQELREE
jgi:hypothetical protein